MNTEKKEIIIKEIQYWKGNKLLPDTYCDFLLALYTEGNHHDEKTVINSTKKNGKHIIWTSVVFVLFLISALVTYFTELSFVLQTVTSVFLLLASMVVTAFLLVRKGHYQLPLVITFVQLLIVSLSFVEYITEGNHFWTAFTVIINCILWVAIGGMFRIYFLLITGIIAFLILGVTIFI
ncbi:hypothetical protein CJ195_07005 [Bacillus sp. UMB0899]|uniref:hypothetical protein n=1 Tax=Metabacillus schmidteae TaxID=2730405 RepID=UPI000C7FF6D3|nr:hypothetical protein [Metabacillus schmidteae]PMC39656.1 hypothetical protein CJ195_07005 [Bacillus sp. UMB0899]